MKRIESRDNKWIKRLNGLKIKKNRDKEGLFIAEGLRFIREIPKNWEVLAYAVSDAFAAENDLSLYEEKAEVLCLTDALFAAVCDTENPQGILAVCKKLDWDADAVLAKKTPFLLLAEELNDPGNLGTVIRTADACGADAVFLSKGSVDLYNPKVLRATMGSLFPCACLPKYRPACPFGKNAGKADSALRRTSEGRSLSLRPALTGCLCLSHWQRGTRPQ